jgi:hypothetical protein
MNTYLIHNSLKYIKTNFEIIVKLSKWINKYFIDNKYNDNKFISSVIKKDIVIADYLSQFVIHKNIFEWGNDRNENNKLDKYYFISSIWINIFKNAELKIIKDEIPFFLLRYLNLDILTIYFEVNGLTYINNLFSSYVYFGHSRYEGATNFIEIGVELRFDILHHLELGGSLDGLIIFGLENYYLNNNNLKIIFEYICTYNNKSILDILIDYKIDCSFFMTKTLKYNLYRRKKSKDIIICLVAINVLPIDMQYINYLCINYDSIELNEKIKLVNLERKVILKNINKYTSKSIKVLYDNGFNFESEDDDILMEIIDSPKLFTYLICLGIKSNTDRPFIDLIKDNDLKSIKILIRNGSKFNPDLLK